MSQSSEPQQSASKNMEIDPVRKNAVAIRKEIENAISSCVETTKLSPFIALDYTIRIIESSLSMHGVVDPKSLQYFKQEMRDQIDKVARDCKAVWTDSCEVPIAFVAQKFCKSTVDTDSHKESQSAIQQAKEGFVKQFQSAIGQLLPLSLSDISQISLQNELHSAQFQEKIDKLNEIEQQKQALISRQKFRQQIISEISELEMFEKAYEAEIRRIDELKKQKKRLPKEKTRQELETEQEKLFRLNNLRTERESWPFIDLEEDQKNQLEKMNNIKREQYSYIIGEYFTAKQNSFTQFMQQKVASFQEFFEFKPIKLALSKVSDAWVNFNLVSFLQNTQKVGKISDQIVSQANQSRLSNDKQGTSERQIIPFSKRVAEAWESAQPSAIARSYEEFERDYLEKKLSNQTKKQKQVVQVSPSLPRKTDEPFKFISFNLSIEEIALLLSVSVLSNVLCSRFDNSKLISQLQNTLPSSIQKPSMIRGNIMRIFKHGFLASDLLTVLGYKQIKQNLEQYTGPDFTVENSIVAGFISGSIFGAIFAPFDRIKTLQVATSRKLIFSEVLRRPLQGIYAGAISTAVFRAIQLPLYEKFKARIANFTTEQGSAQISILGKYAASVTAGVVASTLTYRLDTAKRIIFGIESNKQTMSIKEALNSCKSTYKGATYNIAKIMFQPLALVAADYIATSFNTKSLIEEILY